MTRVVVPLLAPRIRWTLVAAAALAVFSASVLVVPSGEPTPLGPWLDEALHLLGYAALAWLLAYATAHWTKTARRAATVLVLAVGYGLLIELVQAPVAYRQFAVADLVANGLGAFAGTTWLACERWVRYR